MGGGGGYSGRHLLRSSVRHKVECLEEAGVAMYFLPLAGPMTGIKMQRKRKNGRPAHNSDFSRLMYLVHLREA